DLVFEGERLAEILDFWRKACTGRTMPTRQDIDPLTIPPHLLAHIELIDVLTEPELRFRWRLIGTHVTTAVGRDCTGMYFDELYPAEDFETVSGPFKWVAENAKPLRWHGTSGFIGRDWQAYEGVYLPLSSNGATVDMIFCGVQYELK
ncbi:MAG: PAS domain-containing protein, partial [Rhodospirillaceae bacterium]|nr:PAS domain-containing protein [Rhodospirillaceae bacterium]